MNKPRTRTDNVVAEEILGQCVIYDGSTKKAHQLNSTLSWVWKHCDGTRTVDHLAIAMQHDLGYDSAKGVVASGLQQLADAKLLEPESMDLRFAATADSTVSRRTVMAGAAIIAPVIISILALRPLPPNPSLTKLIRERVRTGNRRPRTDQEKSIDRQGLSFRTAGTSGPVTSSTGMYVNGDRGGRTAILASVMVGGAPRMLCVPAPFMPASDDQSSTKDLRHDSGVLQSPEMLGNCLPSQLESFRRATWLSMFFICPVQLLSLRRNASRRRSE